MHGEVGDAEEVETGAIHVEDVLSVAVVEREVFLGQPLQNWDRSGLVPFEKRLMDKLGTRVEVVPRSQRDGAFVLVGHPEIRPLELSDRVTMNVSEGLRESLDHEIEISFHELLVLPGIVGEVWPPVAESQGGSGSCQGLAGLTHPHDQLTEGW